MALTTKNSKTYEDLGREIGELVDDKQDQYGDSFNRSKKILDILYPDGVESEDFKDLLGVTRVIDKLFRIAEGDKGDESAWRDIAGYALLGEMKSVEKEEIEEQYKETYEELQVGAKVLIRSYINQAVYLGEITDANHRLDYYHIKVIRPFHTDEEEEEESIMHSSAVRTRHEITVWDGCGLSYV